MLIVHKFVKFTQLFIRYVYKKKNYYNIPTAWKLIFNMYLFAVFKLKLDMNFMDGKLQRHLTSI